MANRNTYVPTHTRVKARRIRKVMKAMLQKSLALLTNPPYCDEAKKEMEADLKSIYTLTHGKVEKEIDTCGDNHSFEFYNNVDQFEALEVKYIKAPKEALKGL